MVRLDKKISFGLGKPHHPRMLKMSVPYHNVCLTLYCLLIIYYAIPVKGGPFDS